ncbi:MAG TPA: HD domain-containing phosphohydrolase [Thermoanaerobaculia bacterium]|nr:HD domain-containing phosphohydrolase [Thermoanaerobaculia bacterium]
MKLRYVLLIALLLSGIIPLGISSVLLIQSNQEILRDSERDYLIAEASGLSRQVGDYLVTVRQNLSQIGYGVLRAGGPIDPADPVAVAARLREPWVGPYVQSFLGQRQEVLAVRVLDAEGQGQLVRRRDLSRSEDEALLSAFNDVNKAKATSYRFVQEEGRRDPLVVIAVPVAAEPGKAPLLIVEAMLRFRPLLDFESGTLEGEGTGVFLVDREGRLLWSSGGTPEMEQALFSSDVIRSFVNLPMNLTHEYEFESREGTQEVLAQVSAVEENGWGLVVQKPLAAAFAAVDKMIVNTVLSTLLLLSLALFFAYLAARWVSQPIQRLAETSHEIASGNFGGRVEMKGLSFELADLAEDFNLMSGHIEGYIQQLQQAAQANRDLFIGSLRAFVAAIDAKDPYTRGHSERVAAVSRTISRYLQLPEEVQHKVWIGALLHDVGKIGVEDRILRKEGVLTPEEYEQMKLHAPIGADILSSIEQLKEMIPAIRWHHECWNGRGYPDGLKGEQIPLFARIVAVADTFDAITTNRPYQQAYDLQFAVETIKKLTGSRFDAKIVTAFLRAFEAGEIRAGAPRSRTEPAAAPAAATTPATAEPRAAAQR